MHNKQRLYGDCGDVPEFVIGADPLRRFAARTLLR
jgi:hypothetical protein